MQNLSFWKKLSLKSLVVCLVTVSSPQAFSFVSFPNMVFPMNARAMSDACPVTAHHTVLASKGWTVLFKGSGVSDSFYKAGIKTKGILTCEYKSKLKISKNVCPSGYALNKMLVPIGKNATKKGAKYCVSYSQPVSGFSAALIKNSGAALCKSTLNTTVESLKYNSINQSSGIISAIVKCRM